MQYLIPPSPADVFKRITIRQRRKRVDGYLKAVFIDSHRGKLLDYILHVRMPDFPRQRDRFIRLETVTDWYFTKGDLRDG